MKRWVWMAAGLWTGAVGAQPELTAWFTDHSGRYARLYEDNTALGNGTTVTTWSRGQGTQSDPTYAGVHEISYSADWVYVRTTGLASYPMGPWYLDAADNNLFPNYPSNTATQFRIPRVPTSPPGTPALTGLGAIGYFVDGVAMFDSRDAFSYSTSNGSDATPGNGLSGDGVWNRDAYVNESVTFDAGFAHQAGNRYHYHANPIALRQQLGDHVTYDAPNRRYVETGDPPTHHSPIIGWMYDGHPIYGPYAYDDPLDPDSGLRRMISGYRSRTISVRQVLPAHAARDQGFIASTSTSEYTLPSNRYGPTVSAAYPVGHYLEDYEYLGDVGQTQGIHFDLDLHNGRFCVTPEYPEGVYAYFTSIETDGSPRFPYNIGRTYYGDPTGGAVNTVSEAVTLLFEGGPEARATITGTNSQDDGAVQTFTWSPVAGGTYTLESSLDLTDTNAWELVDSDISPTSDVVVTQVVGSTEGRLVFYRLQRQSLATFDDTGFDWDDGSGGGGGTPTDPGVYPASGTRGTSLEVTVIFDASITPPLPPAALLPASFTIGGTALTGVTRPTSTTVVGTLSIPGGATLGTQDVVVTWSGPPPYVFSNAFTFQ